MALTTVRTVAELRAAVAGWRAAGARIAFVPTMGALHAGHLALVGEAGVLAGRVVASIFVNPTQFGPNEDLARYPRQEATDAAALDAAGCDLLFAPTVEDMYPAGFATKVLAGPLGERWCGAARPGHFDGVATVVAKLLNQVRPDVALFGEKDWQQLAVIRRMARDLDLDVAIVGCPTVRDADGLALSSRNAYLSPAEREAAAALPRAMAAAAAAIAAGAPTQPTLAEAEKALLAAGFSSVDYLALVDADSLEPLDAWHPPARLLAAARIGTTRLIDNIAVG